MADFCYDCTNEMFGENHDGQPLGPRNDIAGIADDEDVVPALCEGCGVHLFTSAGRRVCDMDGMPSSSDVTDELCGDCIKEWTEE